MRQALLDFKLKLPKLGAYWFYRDICELGQEGRIGEVGLDDTIFEKKDSGYSMQGSA